MEEMKEPSESSPTTFSSLPEDIVLDCLARVSRFHHPTLSLVSRDVRSVIASPELEATRSRMGIREDFVCLDLNKNNPNPRWFILSVFPKQQKLLPLPLFPYQHPKSSTVVSINSVIYIIGGFVNGKRSNRVLILDCISHQWRSLPNMCQPRVSPAADVIDGKIYVIGDSLSLEDWGEVYDPKTQTLEPLLPSTLDLTTQKSVVPGILVMGGKVYDMKGLKLDLKTNVCLVDNALCLMSNSNHNLFWNDPTVDKVWRFVQGLEQLSRYTFFFNNHGSMGNCSGGRRVTMWWKYVVRHPPNHYCTEKCKTKIWCAEVSFERRGLKELWGSVEWSNNVFTFDGCDSRSGFFLHSVMITH